MHLPRRALVLSELLPVHSLLRFAWVCASFLLAPVRADAVTLYSASIPNYQAVTNSTSPVALGPYLTSRAWPDFCCGAGSSGTSATASADSAVGGSAHAFVNLPSGYPSSVAESTGGGGEFSGDEIVISGPSGQSIVTSINITLNGALSATGDGSQAPGGFTATAHVDVLASLSGPHGSYSAGGSLDLQTTGGQSQLTASGLLGGVTGGSGNVSSPTFQVVSGDHILVGFKIGTSAFCGESFGSGAFSCDALSDYSHTFGFATGGPVFNLPDGWTANSLDGSIVNNVFVVPEPATGLLVMVGVLGLAVQRRRAGCPLLG